MARENEKTVTIKDRTFKIGKFDAFTGSYIAFTLFEKMMPMGVEEKVMSVLKAEGNNPEAMLPQGRALMTKGEFFAFQRDCLSVVKEVKKGGHEQPILNSNGSWGVLGIERDTMLVLVLTLHALLFNVSGFFTENGLKDLADSFKDMIPSNMPT